MKHVFKNILKKNWVTFLTFYFNTQNILYKDRYDMSALFLLQIIL